MVGEEGGWAMRASVLVRQPASEDLPSQPLYVQHCPTQGKDTSKDTLPASKRQFCLVLEVNTYQTSTVIPGLIYWPGFEWGVGEVVGCEYQPEAGKSGCEEGASTSWESKRGIWEGNPRQEIGGGGVVWARARVEVISILPHRSSRGKLA